jgi:hypothetical protein
MVINSTNINKTNKIKERWSSIPPISTKRIRLKSDGHQFRPSLFNLIRFVDIGGIDDHHSLILFALLILVELMTITL